MAKANADKQLNFYFRPMTFFFETQGLGWVILIDCLSLAGVCCLIFVNFQVEI